MSFDFSMINWWAVLVATFATSILGGLWFAVLFGRPYAASLGREFRPGEKPAPIFVFGPLVCGVATTVANALLLQALGIESIGGALLLAVFVAFGYLVPTMANTAINPNVPRPLAYIAISGPYFLLANIVGTLVLQAMR